MKTSTKLAMAVAIACMGVGSVAFAAEKGEREKAWEQEWKTYDAEKGVKTEKYGPSCEARFTSRGEGRVGLGITQFWAKLRAERDWRAAAIKLYGPEYAKWTKARDKVVTCETKDKLLLCKATATPCK